MRTARTRSAIPAADIGHLVTVEADIGAGLPRTVIDGLPDAQSCTTRDRVRAAVVNSAEHWPTAKITVTVQPADLPRQVAALDLAIAVAVLAADGSVPAPPDGVLFLAELGLDGRLRPVPGSVNTTTAAAESGATTVVMAAGDQAEVPLTSDITVVAANNLANVLRWLRSDCTWCPRRVSHR